MLKKTLVADHIDKIPFSGIRRFFDLAKEIDGVISLGVGEPDFETPWVIREKAIHTLENSKTVYTSNAGLIELRKEICKYLKETIKLKYSPENQVIVTVGASEGIDIALRAIINPGDEVLIVEPCYVSYKPCVIMSGGVPVIINTKIQNNFRLKPEEILEKITPKTKALIISYPNNPTGAIMEEADLLAISNVLNDKNIVVISDEIYSELTYEGIEHKSIAQMPGMYDKTIVLNGFSKAFSMTGWRIGYAVGPEYIISAMLKVHQYVIMCAPTVSQYAGIDALKDYKEIVKPMKSQYERRRRFMINGFREMGLECFEALGAFYLFPCIKKTGMTSEQFCNELLKNQKVAVVPGTAFGDTGEGFIRCSYAYSIEEIKQALDKISIFVRKHLNK